MTSSDRHAQEYAFLHQYLIHQALDLYDPKSVTIDLGTMGEEECGISLDIAEQAKIKKTPKLPAKIKTENVAQVEQNVCVTKQGQNISWTWPKPSGFLANWIAAYTIELLRFTPVPVQFAGTTIRTGLASPLYHNATGISAIIDENTILVAVREPEEPRLNWLQDEDTIYSNPVRPNIVFPDGLTRISPRFHRATRKTNLVARLGQDQPRAEAHQALLEFRLVLNDRNRRRLAHPNTPGLGEDIIDQAIRVAHELHRQWLEHLHQAGYITDQPPEVTSPHVHKHTTAEPWGKLKEAAVRHPLEIDDRYYSAHLRHAIRHAVAAQTLYTVVDNAGPSASRLTMESVEGLTFDDTPQRITFDPRYGDPTGDLGAERHPEVRPMRSMTAHGRLLHPNGEEQPIDLDVPIMMTISNSHETGVVERLYVTARGRESLTVNQVINFLEPIVHPMTRVIQLAKTAIEGPDQAFVQELGQMLDKWRPRARRPNRPITVTFDQEGYTITNSTG